jgi:Xaa-Pro dipeptidase
MESAHGQRSAPNPRDDLYLRHLGELERRLADALESRAADGVAIYAGRATKRWRDDISYPFHAEPYFRAWIPLPQAGSWLKLVPGRRPRLVFLQRDDFWHAPIPDPVGPWVEHFDVVYAREDAGARRLLGDLGRLDALGPELPAAGFASRNDPDLLSHLDYHRAFKTEYEQACIATANALAVPGHAAVGAAFLAAAHSEFALQRCFADATLQLDAELPYPSIVALNEHAAILHYDRLEREPPRLRHALLIDAGAEFRGYAGDISRTWCGPDGTAAFKALLAAMEQLQLELCALVKPGVDFVALNERTHEQLAGVLQNCGLVRCSADEALELGITRAFLPHGLGHLLGLQVHDVGGRQIAPDGEIREPPAEHPYLRLTRRLEAGFVLTIEPGIYFIPSLLGKLAAETAGRKIDWPAVEQLAGYGGIRIEDNVLVTASEPLNLTRAAFADRTARALPRPTH